MTSYVQESFKALADPTRRMILTHLSKGDMTIGEVTDRFDMTRAAIKKHLTILEEGQLITVQTQGRERVNRLKPEGMQTVCEWIGFFDQFWDDRLGALKAAVEGDQANIDKLLKGKSSSHE
ncbi:ArsR/SmtB family transcription factor [Kiloniella antarctica]|uniref:ArsR/SmtB family transcription factor n=1 Tax=Kiloniella antarctica TaxID=1550907 RepID=A0ABW5BL99_9PROT